MSTQTLTRPFRLRFAATLGAVLAVLCSAPVTGARAQGNFNWTDLFLPESQEKVLAESEHPKVLEQFGGAYEDPALNDYVQSLVDFLGQASDRSDIDYHVTILNSPVVNAFALPAGYVYVTRGLLALAGSEAELAGVLAHEIGHVTAKHMSQRLLISQGVTGLLGAAGGGSAWAQLGQLAGTLLFSGFSQEHEHEADQLGIATMSRAGFDPYAMPRFLAKLEAKTQLDARLSGQPADAGAGFNLLATHPRTPERVERSIAQARVTAVRDPMAARDIYLSKIDGLLYGDDPAHGYARGRLFAHPGLNIRFEVPAGFQLLNGQKQVTAQGPNGASIKFDTAPRVSGTTMDYLRGVWAKDLPLQDAELITINGFEAATGRLESNAGGAPRDLRLVVIDSGAEGYYRFLFSSAAPRPRELEEAFIRTAYSFGRLGSAERRELRPYHLTLYTVQPGDTAAGLASWLPFDSEREARFRVLNGLGPRDKLTPGRTVKLVRG